MSRHVVRHVGNIEPCWLQRCPVNVMLAWQLPDMFAHVGKKTANSITILCNNQIIMAAVRWRLGRCAGWPLKIVAALGPGGSSGRWATRVLTLTSCDERGGWRTGTSNLTINYFKRNGTSIYDATGRNATTTRRYAMTRQRQWYKMDNKTEQAMTTRCNTTTQQSNKVGMTRCVRGGW